MNSNLFTIAIIAFVFTSSLSLFVLLIGNFIPDKFFSYHSVSNTKIIAIFLFTFVIVFYITKLIPLALAVASLTIMVPYLISKQKEQQLTLKRMESIAIFAQSIADGVGGGHDLQAAVISASSMPPDAILEEVKRLKFSIHARPFDECIVNFVNDVSNPAADLLGAHLLQASTFASGRLAPALRKVSTSLNDYILTQKKLVTSRRKQEFEVRGLTILFVSFMALILIFAPDMFKTYSDNYVGQLKLALVFGLVFLGWFLAGKYTEVLKFQDFKLNREALK